MTYWLNPLVLVPPMLKCRLQVYLTVHETSMGYVLRQHDESGKKEQAAYYVSKKFADYESLGSTLEKICCALVWLTQRLRHYMLYHMTLLISPTDPMKYLFEKPALSG